MGGYVPNGRLTHHHPIFKYGLIATCFFILTGLPTTLGATIKIAWLAPHSVALHLNASSSLGAILYAMETIENDTTLLPGYDLE